MGFDFLKAAQKNQEQQKQFTGDEDFASRVQKRYLDPLKELTNTVETAAKVSRDRAKDALPTSAEGTSAYKMEKDAISLKASLASSTEWVGEFINNNAPTVTNNDTSSSTSTSAGPSR